MSVSNDVALSVDLLGRRIVVCCSINEIAGLKIVDRHFDVESRVGCNVLAIYRRREFRRRHIRRRSDDTHWRRVARARLGLQAICDGLISDGKAKIDEVVSGSEGGNLASRGRFLTVAREPFGDDAGIES